LKEGNHYQDFVVDELYKIGLPVITYTSKEYQYTFGENKAGIEIKFDNRLKETGNLYIEISEKTNKDNLEFIPSGIFREDNSWLYVIGDFQFIYIFGKKFLKQLHFLKRYREVEIETSRGYLLPKDDAEKYSLKKIIVKSYL